MRIRYAQLADADAVFGLLGQLAMSYRPQRSAFDQSFELLLSAMTYDSADLLVAEDGGTVIGYALTRRFPVLYANGPVSELHELVVDEAHRGRGAGRRLVEAVIARARTAGAVELTVPTRRAHDFYRRFGFEETATVMKLPLPPD
ncbi:GNAT family N-acetyltransferase [Amycolatopsis taiwanensis]|uniref:GNAT family N-acetyltransferase n=1 Tax=Amycolatopsis taiwanensis TaxID=342230 RepID=UPI0004840DED|nr:GNAT family N-acetyltransferase [Amycolatopsis taiwanensis]